MPLLPDSLFKLNYSSNQRAYSLELVYVFPETKSVMLTVYGESLNLPAVPLEA